MIHKGDGILGMTQIRNSALVLTDIPSGKTQAEWDRLPDLDAFFNSAWGALRPNGALVVIVSHMDVAAELVRRPRYRYDLVWRKSIATGFLNASGRPLRNHEHILVFYRAQPTYNPQMTTGHEPIHAASRTGCHGENYGSTGTSAARTGATDRFPVSVIDVPCVGTTSPERVHPQQKPVALMRWLIETYSAPGDLVLDPFAGSGSTGVAANDCGRDFLGWEIREDATEHPTIHQSTIFQSTQ